MLTFIRKKTRKEINKIHKKVSNIRIRRVFKMNKVIEAEYKEGIFIRHLLINHFNLRIFSYLELGCNEPIINSVTYDYYKEGSYGVCVDANPIYAKKYKEVRPNDTFINAGVTDGEDGETQDFYITSDKISSTFDKHWVENVLVTHPKCRIEKTIRVKLRNINSIMDEYFKSTPDFLLIDLEGLDFKVLKSLNFEIHRPKVIMIETLVLPIDNNAQLENCHKIAEFLAAKRYHWVCIYGFNGIFADKDQFTRNSLFRLV